MSLRHVGFWLVAALAVAWSAQALIGHAVRLTQQPVIQAIRKGDVAPDRRTIAAAMAQYAWAMRLSPCNTALFADRALLAAYEADSTMASADMRHGDAALDSMQSLLVARLACTPRDGKAWLDVAMLDVFREGVSPRALMAYRMSALAAPGESWLAKKRLEFALTFLPVLKDDELAVARADLAVLERAHPNNLLAVQAAAQVADKQALYALFGAKMPVDVP
jgi:hypothetical protein